MTSMIRTYSELIKLTTFERRYEYLRLSNVIGDSTFGYDRYLNQHLYRSKVWRRARDYAINRDNACDLGFPGHDIFDRIVIHHMNPLTIEQIQDGSKDIIDPEFLICTSQDTHLAIHYGRALRSSFVLAERRPNDTIPWRRE